VARAPFQVLVFPFRHTDSGEPEYALFRRSDSGLWQGIAGGGEEDESPLQAARRETWEEAGIPQEAEFVALDSMTTMPVEAVVGSFLWGDSVYVIPEYSFGVRADQVTLSGEHLECRWVSYDQALSMLKWDSNRNALWEIHQRLSARGAR